MILASLIAIMLKKFLVQLKRHGRSWKFLLTGHAILYGKGIAIDFREGVQCYVFTQCHNI